MDCRSLQPVSPVIIEKSGCLFHQLLPNERDNNASINIAREGYRLIARLPMDGGEVTPVEKTALQQNNQGPAVTDFEEAGRVLEREATCL